jgi:hypothetical protein
MTEKVPFLFWSISNFLLLIPFISAQDIHEGLSPRAYVETDNGALMGNTSLSRNGHTYFQFLGVPYGHAERFAVRISKKFGQ